MDGDTASKDTAPPDKSAVKIPDQSDEFEVNNQLTADVPASSTTPPTDDQPTADPASLPGDVFTPPKPSDVGDSLAIPANATSTIDRQNKPPNLESIQPPSPHTPPPADGPQSADLSSGSGTKPRLRHLSGNPPGVQGVIIGSRTSRDSSPLRNTSPFVSPRVSPGFHMADRTFPYSSGGARPKMPTSTSDNTIQSGGTRPKSAPRDLSSGTTPTQPRERNPSSSDSRRYSDSRLSSQRRSSRLRVSIGPVEGVVQDTETVLKGYMHERYTLDTLRTDGDFNTPRSPDAIENFSPTAQTATSAVGRRLATIGDEINIKYGGEFKKMSKALNIQQGAVEHAYNAFSSVAVKLFDDGISMGRIVALLQFGYHIAIEILQQGIGDFMTDIIGWLVRFISQERIMNAVTQAYQSIAEWIASMGGWQAAADSMSELGNQVTENAPYVLAFLGTSAAVAYAAWWFSKR